MTADATPSYFPSMPPTFGWRRVVELADEFKVSTADMLAICDRLGVVVEDASEWLAPDTVDLIRDVVAVGGPAAILKPPAAPKAPKPERVRAEKLRAEKPPKQEKVRAVKPPKPDKPRKPEKQPKVRAEKPPKPEKIRAEKPPKQPRVKAERLPKPEKAPKAPKAAKVTTPNHGSESPALASVSRDGVRTRRVVVIGLVIALLAAGTGVLVDRWVEYVTSTDTPATVVTTGER